MGWLSRLNPFTEPNTVTECDYVIRDAVGVVEIDKGYAELGEREGWLTYSAYRMRNGRCILEYRHTPPIVWSDN